MNKPNRLKKGDKVAIVSLSSGILGENFCEHTLKLGIKRIKEFGLEPVIMPNALKGIEFIKNNPRARASDLKIAFMDDNIKAIICAIGGDDTYKTLPFLLKDNEFIEKVKSSPKIFTGFSDSTINHLMFYKLGMITFYGPNFICDLAELEEDMLEYTKRNFKGYLNENIEIKPSKYWYEERTDFSKTQIGVRRIKYKEEKGYEVVQGNGKIKGKLLGGCLESLYDILTINRYEDEKQICDKFKIFPSIDEWKGKILFIETCEEKPTPEKFEEELIELKKKKVFDKVEGIIVGKPQDEMYYEEYKEKLIKVVSNKTLPIMCNLNFGHALPRCVIPYGIEIEIDLEKKEVEFLEDIFSNQGEK